MYKEQIIINGVQNLLSNPNEVSGLRHCSWLYLAESKIWIDLWLTDIAIPIMCPFVGRPPYEYMHVSHASTLFILYVSPF